MFLTRRTMLLLPWLSLSYPLRGFAFDDEAEIRAIKALGVENGMDPFGIASNAQYLAIGDAKEDFRKAAIKILLGLLEDYLKQFKAKGFEIESPKSKLTVVTLGSEEAFNAFLGAKEGEDLAIGQYDLDNNRLVMYDGRRSGPARGNEQANTYVLMHEAMHQLTFNTGLLDRDSDIPLAVSEGLGCFAESRRPDGRVKIGEVNTPRAKVLATLFPKRGKVRGLFPTEELVTDDQFFRDPDDYQAAYAQAWVMIHWLLKTPEKTMQFRKYLETIRSRRSQTQRLEDWKKAFGDMAVFDRDLTSYAKKFV